MSRRNSYSDVFTGEEDKGIRRIIEGCDNEDSRAKLKKILLKVIKNELTPRQNEIIMLYYFKSMDITSIGRQLGITPQAVSAAMSRARLRIFRVLQYYL